MTLLVSTTDLCIGCGRALSMPGFCRWCVMAASARRVVAASVEFRALCPSGHVCVWVSELDNRSNLATTRPTCTGVE